MYPGGGSEQGRYGDGQQPASPGPGYGDAQGQPQPGYSVPLDYPMQPGQEPAGDYPQPGYEPSGYQPQPGYPPQPAGYPQPGYAQPGYPPSGYDQAAYRQPGPGQAGYAQPGYEQPAYPPAGYPQQPAYQHTGYEQQPAGYPPPPPTPSRTGTGVIIGIVAVIAVVAILSVLGVALHILNHNDNRQAGGPGGSGSSTAPSAGAPNRSTDPADGLVIGTGPVHVDIYVDYQCPPCSTFEDATADTLSGYLSANRIVLAIHPVAFIDNRSKNKYATRAAAAAACAYDENKLMEYHSYLLRHQPAEDTLGPTDSDLISAGAQVGLGTGFASCVTGQRRLVWVAQATSAASRNGVSSVPALRVNGRTVSATRSDLTTAVNTA